jgi:hypothetical protein
VKRELLYHRGEGKVLQSVAMMGLGQKIELDTPLALEATRLPIAGRMMVAAAQARERTLRPQGTNLGM